MTTFAAVVLVWTAAIAAVLALLAAAHRLSNSDAAEESSDAGQVNDSPSLS